MADSDHEDWRHHRDPCCCGQVLARLDAIDKKLEHVMTALMDLQNADAALKTEVATFLTDIAAALGAEDPDIEQVTSDIQAQVTALQSADPANQTPPPPTPVA